LGNAKEVVDQFYKENITMPELKHVEYYEECFPQGSRVNTSDVYPYHHELIKG